MRGGARPGSGRPSRADEQKVTDLAQAAIVSKFGSLEKGFEYLLQSGESTLIKFVWEHAVGKPREKIDVDGVMQIEQITGMEFKSKKEDDTNVDE